MIHTRICDLLGIRHPIVLGGMGTATTAPLVAAVSNAGGFGVLGASGMPADAIGRLVARTRELTERPFGVNVIIAEDGPGDRAFLTEAVRAATAARVAAVVLFWGDAAPYVPEAHAGGAKVLIQVGSVVEAQAAAAAGVDAVIVQGVEAGGHIKPAGAIVRDIARDAEAALR